MFYSKRSVTCPPCLILSDTADLIEFSNFGSNFVFIIKRSFNMYELLNLEPTDLKGSKSQTHKLQILPPPL